MSEANAALNEPDAALLRAAIALSARSRAAGNHPFAGIIADVDGEILAQAGNTVRIDCTCHAEMNAIRIASTNASPDALRLATLYSSAEPCAVCAGGIY